MTSQLDLSPIVPWLFLCWVGAGVVAVVGLAIDQHHGRLPARPLLSAAWQCARIGIVFTAYGIGSEIYSHELISLTAFVLAMAVIVLIVFGIDWLTRNM
jgi:hypothetical protein